MFISLAYVFTPNKLTQRLNTKHRLDQISSSQYFAKETTKTQHSIKIENSTFFWHKKENQVLVIKIFDASLLFTNGRSKLVVKRDH